MLFSEFVDINPRVSIEKGTEYPCVMMDEVQPGEKFVSGVISKPFKSGTKFKKDDTLFARITPCLENGKIAKYTGHYGLCGFGSTEFFVFRAKDGISDSDYVYYLALSDIIRKPAEASMFGASGRQRADLSVIENIEIDPPSLPIQKKIAGILSAYDDLIENNSRRIKILEEMAQAIYQEWFVKFKFPGHEKVRMVDSPLGKIPERWGTQQIKDLVNIESGFAFKSSTFDKEGKYGVVTIKNVQDGRFISECQNKINELPHNMPDYCKLETGDILLSLTGNIGRVCFVYGENYLLNQRVAKLDPKNKMNRSFIYFLYFQPWFRTKLERIATGVAQQNLSPIEMGKMRILSPADSILEQYADICNSIIDEILFLFQKNLVLRCTRDLLLPKLISGEIDVEDLDIDVGELAE